MKRILRPALIVFVVTIMISGIVLGTLAYTSRERCPFKKFNADQILLVWLDGHEGNESYRLSTKETYAFEKLLQDFKVSGFVMDRDSDKVQHNIGDGASCWSFLVWYKDYEYVCYTGIGDFLFVNGKAYYADIYHQSAMLKFWRQVCADNGFDINIC